MLGRLMGTAIGLIALAALVAGSASARGGNHGCSEADRSFHENHFFAGGDHVVAGHAIITLDFPRAARGLPGPEKQELVRTGNSETPGGKPITSTCGGHPPGFWGLFISELGPGDDSVRMDAKGLDDKNDYTPLTRDHASLVKGGPGDDTIRGHSGFDDLTGGAGADVLRPEAGRDRVRGGGGADLVKAAGGAHDGISCGPGKDKAIVDERDDVRGCERVVERSG